MRTTMKNETVIICPKCGGTQIESTGTMTDTMAMIGGISPSVVHRCAKCGNQGVFPIIDKKDVEDFVREIK